MKQHIEDTVEKIRELCGEHFHAFVLIAALSPKSREPYVTHSGSLFEAHGLALAASNKLDPSSWAEDDDDDDDDGDPFHTTSDDGDDDVNPGSEDPRIPT